MSFLGSCNFFMSPWLTVWSWGCLVEYTTTVASSAAVGFVVPLPFTAPRWAPVGSDSCSATMQSSGQSVVWDLRLPTAPTDLEHDPSLRGRASQHGLALYRSATQQVVLQMGSGSTGTQSCTPQTYAQCAWYVAMLPLKHSGPRRGVSMLLPCEDATSRYSTLMSVEV